MNRYWDGTAGGPLCDDEARDHARDYRGPAAERDRPDACDLAGLTGPAWDRAHPDPGGVR